MEGREYRPGGGQPCGRRRLAHCGRRRIGRRVYHGPQAEAGGMGLGCDAARDRERADGGGRSACRSRRLAAE
eukprot:2988239-Pyramimonas_sp.AAC.1